MKRLFLTLILAGMAASAAAGIVIQHWTTPSGAKVFFVENHDLPILDLQVDFAAGDARDPAGKSGVAALTRGLIDAGAGNLDEEQIAGRWADLGARLSASGDMDRSGFTLRTLASAAERDGAIDLLRTLLSQPTYPEPVLEREKARTIAALQEAETRPDAIAARRFSEAVYPGHPYGRTPTTASIAAIGRDDLLAFYRSRYSPRHAAVSLMGDVTRAEAEAIARRLTDALPAGDENVPLPAVALPQQQTISVPHPATQSHILIGMSAIRRGDPDFFPLLVGNYTLGGGGFVSRLMNEVREKRGMAYSVYSYFAPRRLEGPFQIGLETRRGQADEALKVVHATLDGFLAQGPTPAELRAAKQNLVDGMALRIDSNAKLLGQVSTIGFYGLPLTWLDDFPKRVEAVTATQVREAFARHVQADKLVTVIVADK